MASFRVIIVFRLAPEAEGHGTDAAIAAYHHRPRGIRARVPLVKLGADLRSRQRSAMRRPSGAWIGVTRRKGRRWIVGAQVLAIRLLGVPASTSFEGLTGMFTTAFVDPVSTPRADGTGVDARAIRPAWLCPSPPIPRASPDGGGRSTLTSCDMPDASRSASALALALAGCGSGTPDTIPDVTSTGSPATAAISTDAPWQTTTVADVRTGEAFTIADLAGKVVVIEPMAAWCIVCVRQQQAVAAVLASIDSEDIVHISVDVDPKETPGDLAAYAEHWGFDWPFVRADQTLLQHLVAAFGNRVLSPPAIPTLLVGRDGTVTGPTFGLIDAHVFEAEVRAALSR